MKKQTKMKCIRTIGEEGNIQHDWGGNKTYLGNGQIVPIFKKGNPT